ncbi:MAG: hypothetical protein H6654_15420 [Ardenticatenaceae bacterium]|nr:hypothetical protein [Anaerolineales bacterium]MCB8939628.1 hypothetical protein [Ardenticatenaceae bacterium]MCB8974947.1 hypothetical protein [Ardenticatenaceae bacterium]
MKPVDDQLYQVYLLRFWRNRTDAPWRATLESGSGGVQRHFATVQELVHFLETNSDQPTTHSK